MRWTGKEGHYAYLEAAYHPWDKWAMLAHAWHRPEDFGLMAGIRWEF